MAITSSAASFDIHTLLASSLRRTKLSSVVGFSLVAFLFELFEPKLPLEATGLYHAADECRRADVREAAARYKRQGETGARLEEANRLKVAYRQARPGRARQLRRHRRRQVCPCYCAFETQQVPQHVPKKSDY